MGVTTVLAELEEWDNTTDVIVWLIEREFKQVKCPTLKLQNCPREVGMYRHWQQLESQKVRLTGSMYGKSFERNFFAEQIEIPCENNGEVDGFRVTVEEDKIDPISFKTTTTKLAEYIIKGTDRTEFKIISNK